MRTLILSTFLIFTFCNIFCQSLNWRDIELYNSGNSFKITEGYKMLTKKLGPPDEFRFKIDEFSGSDTIEIFRYGDSSIEYYIDKIPREEKIQPYTIYISDNKMGLCMGSDELIFVGSKINDLSFFKIFKDSGSQYIYGFDDTFALVLNVNTSLEIKSILLHPYEY